MVKKSNDSKVQVYSGLGRVTPMFSIGKNRMYYYGVERDRKDLHEVYGGRQYHFGIYEAGYLKPAVGTNDLIEFGYWRTDARSEQALKVVGHYKDGWETKEIFGYAPFNYFHRDRDCEKPFVLTDGTTIAFLKEQEIVEALKGWKKIREEAVEIGFPVFDPQSAEMHGQCLRLHNPHHMGGVNALRFFDLRQWRPSNEKPVTSLNDQRKVCNLLDLTAVNENSRDTNWADKTVWLHMHKLGFFDAKLGVDPLTIVGEIHDGWVGDGSGLIWRRKDHEVYAMLETPWEKLAEVDAKFIFEVEAEWIEFEENVPVVEWFSLDEPARRERLMSGIIAKAENMLEAHERELKYAAEKLAKSERLMSLLQANRELVVSLADSYAVGNCHPGTDRFCKAFGITSETVLVGDLLDHKKFTLMLTNSRFEAVLWRVLKNAGLADGIEVKPRRPVRRPVEEDEVNNDELLGKSTLARLTGSDESE